MRLSVSHSGHARRVCFSSSHGMLFLRCKGNRTLTGAPSPSHIHTSSCHGLFKVSPRIVPEPLTAAISEFMEAYPDHLLYPQILKQKLLLWCWIWSAGDLRLEGKFIALAGRKATATHRRLLCRLLRSRRCW